MTALAPVLEGFFTERLTQRRASSHTVASYRDTFCLLLRYADHNLHIPPSRLDLTDIDAPFVAGFLDHLEHGPGLPKLRPAANWAGCSISRLDDQLTGSCAVSGSPRS